MNHSNLIDHKPLGPEPLQRRLRDHLAIEIERSANDLGKAAIKRVRLQKP